MGNNSIKSNICFNKIKKNSYQIIFSLYHLNISCFKYDQEQGFYAYHYCKRYGTYKVTLKIRMTHYKEVLRIYIVPLQNVIHKNLNHRTNRKTHYQEAYLKRMHFIIY